MKNRRLLEMMLWAACWSALAGGPVQAKDLNFVIVAKGVHPWYDPAGDGFKLAAKELGGIQARYTAPSEWSGEAQAKMVEDLIAAGVDGISVAVYDVGALVPTINEAMKRGIPVVAFDAGAPDSKQIMFIGTDNPAAGKLQGEEFVRLTGEKCKFVIWVQDLVSLNVKERVEGNRRVIRNYPGMKEITGEQASNYDMSIALRLSENLLNAYGDDLEGAIDMGMDGGTAMYKTLKERKVPPGKLKIIGWSSLPDVVEGIKAGYIAASMCQNPYAMGYLSCYALKYYRDGKRPTVKAWDTGIKVLTKENMGTLEEYNRKKAHEMLPEFTKAWNVGKNGK